MQFIDSNIHAFIWFSTTCIILVFVLISIMWFLSIKNNDQDKILPYECGFDEFSTNRGLLDIHYYIIGILFLLFDVETIYLVPWALNINFFDYIGFLTLLIFFVLLLIGFFYEWVKGSLNWMNY